MLLLIDLFFRYPYQPFHVSVEMLHVGVLQFVGESEFALDMLAF
jgi:hypothetical protein